MTYLKWKKNKNNHWQSYYKGRIIELKTNGTLIVNGRETQNRTIKTIINFIDDGLYNFI
jgi:hypothetical protein